jgi:hypothetical protein
MDSKLTQEQAIKLGESKFWEKMSYRDRAGFQLFEERLCMPFGVFHEAVEKSLGRPVWTHEFGMNLDGIKKEFLGVKQAPTFQEIIDLIPPEKRIIITTE